VWHLDHTMRKTRFIPTQTPLRLVRLVSPCETDVSAYFDCCLRFKAVGGTMKNLVVGIGSGRFRSSLLSLATSTALAIGAAISLPVVSFADENGVSFWLLGLFGSLAAVPQQPGWAFTAINYFTPVTASGAVAASREITIGKFSPTVNVNLNVNLNTKFETVILNPNYVFATPILGGQLNVGVLAFVADNSTALNGSLTVASGGLAIMRQGSISQTTIGFGDLYPEAIIRWNSGVNNWMVYGAGDIPVGDYSSTNLANIGIGHVAVDGGGGYTYFNPQTSSGDNPAIALLSVLGNTPPPKVVINEMTTVASAFTGARFVKGEAISGNPLGLRIAAGNVPNLVNLETGGWGKVIVDAGNSTWTTTLANFDTLASLITAFATVANDDWRTRFFKAATATGGAIPKNTLEAMAGIARTPWANPTALYGLFDEAYPQPKDGSRRAAPFAPYLAYTPTDFTLSLWFGGGGSYANGNMVFDAEGNM
jgi:hypothetical protein